MTKYLFVTGGVVSSLGKGVASASLGFLLELRGYKVNLLKFDPYLNIDASTMSPYQHGEVFVTKDGSECDLDLGHYERFTNAQMTKENNVTTGKIYQAVIQKEREGKFLGKTVQVIPHITDEIKQSIFNLASSSNCDILICEIGGTVGDIESLPFLEAVRQFSKDVGKENVLYIHLTLIPYIQVSDEAKTKPTQHSIGRLREIGIRPDILLCRTQKPLDKDMKDKIALFCDVEFDSIIDAIDVSYVYEIPLIFKEQDLDKVILKKLSLSSGYFDLERWEKWKNFVSNLKNPQDSVKIAVVGKYTKLKDAYKSIIEALIHAGGYLKKKVEIKWIESEMVEDQQIRDRLLKDTDGILVPGGFGYRGVRGKISAINYAREKEKNFLGICLGMQCAVIEYAQNVVNLEDANSTEFYNNTKNPVITHLPNQKAIKYYGGTLRLGEYITKIKEDTGAFSIYKKEFIKERHRHRYEVNEKYIDKLEVAGLKFSGYAVDSNCPEICEIPTHPFFIAVQFHPEFISKPLSPHPLFLSFLQKDKSVSENW